MRRLKRIICWVLCVMIMSTVILPMLPVLEVKAEVSKNGKLDESKEQHMYEDDNSTVYIYQASCTVNAFSSPSNGFQPKDSSGSVIKALPSAINSYSLVDEDSDYVANTDTSNQSLGIVEDYFRIFGLDAENSFGSAITANGDYVVDLFKNLTHLGARYHIEGSDTQNVTIDSYYHAVLFDQSSGSFYTVVITIVDAISTSYWSTINIYIVKGEGIYDLYYYNTSGKNQGYYSVMSNGISSNVIGSVFTKATSLDTLVEDIANPNSVSNDTLEQYRLIDNLFTIEKQDLYKSDGTATGRQYFKLNLDVIGYIYVEENQYGQNKHESDVYYNYSILHQKDTLSSVYGGLYFGVDLNNPNYIVFGDSGSVTIDDMSDYKFDAVDSSGRKYIDDASSEVGNALSQFIQTAASASASISGTTSETVLEAYEKNVKSLASKIGTTKVLGMILDTYADNLTSLGEGYAIDSVQDFVNSSSQSLECDNTDYGIVSAIVGYNVQCISNKTSFSGKLVSVDNTVIYLTTSSSIKNVYEGSAVTLWSYWDKLTNYQKAMIAITYKNIVDARGLKSNSDYLRTVYDYSSYGNYTQDAAQNVLISFDDIKTTISNRDSNLKDTYSLYNIAINANTLGQYIVGTALYGTGSSDSTSIYNIYDATLAGLMTKDYTLTDVNASWYPQYLPKDIGIFNNNSEDYVVLLSSGTNGLEVFVSFLYNVSYAFDVAAFSTGGEEYNFDPEALREYFKTGNYSTDNSDYASSVSGEFSWFTGNSISDLDGSTLPIEGDDLSINMLRSIIELHDLCEFLGILDTASSGGWTDAIEQYLGIYSDNEAFFNKLRNNNNIYNHAEVGTASIDEPLGVFFNIEDKEMSDQWCKGFAASALFVPMETNIYDASSISYINDPDFISDFYYKYAFYRKALYINTDNSAIVNAKVSGSVSGTRVATLRDLINYDRDIILTVDDNFYNANQISDVISGLDYTSVRNGSDADTATGWTSLKNWVSDLFDLSPEQILKTGANSYYSSTLANSVTKLGGTPTLTSSIADVYVLSEDDLIGDNSVFEEYEYSVKQSYGVVSAVYRSAELYNECLRALASDNAIFKSSKAICSTPGTTSSDWRSIYNYCMLANLEDQMKNDAASSLDLDAPVFCDLFGNIVTESGLVIIPAACNATLCGTNWNPNTVGWSEYYNNGNRLATGEFSDEVYEWLTGVSYNSNGTATQQVQYISGYDGDGNPIYVTSTIAAADTTTVGQYGEEVSHDNAGGYMIVDRSGVLVLRTSSLSGSSASAIIQWENLNKNSTVVKELFYNDAYFTKAASGDIYSKTLVNLVVETLRGAPIEYIDYEYEGLSGNTDISKFGVYMAYKLEELTNALVSGTNGNAVGGNALVTMPNLAFVTGIEYIVLYVFKVVFAVMIVGLAISLYIDAVKNHLGIKSVGKFVFTCMLTIVAITLVPNLISWSYYKANKQLLASESGYIMMLNYVKDYDGAEIGITSVETPETTTELYVKLDDVSVSWWDVIYEVLFNNTLKTVTELYQNQLTDNAMAMQDGVELKGDGLYMNVQNIFDSTSIVYYPTQNRLSNIVYSSGGGSSSSKAGDKDTVVSFTLPYYVILDKLVANIDEYNESKDITAYSWSVGSNGHIMTYDIISPYLTSSEFLDEGFDILGMNEVLETGNKMTSYTEGYFSDDELQRMKLSRWYPSGDTTDTLTQDRITELYEYARNYIGSNSEILGKVPDEVFLKVFALQLSIKYNQIFDIHTGNAIEIMNVDTRDIARLLVADKASVYKYYSYGFARFTYEESGSIGVIFTAMYFVVLWVTSILKPLFMILILALLIINVIFRKVLFRKESRCVEGYLIGCACLVACNYAYAGMLKITLSISEYGFGTVLAVATALLVQILYVAGLCAICAIEVKDWKNNGFNEFATIGSSITSGLMHAQSVIADKFISRQNSAYNDAKGTRRYTSDEYDMNSVDDMLDRDEERQEVGTYSQI